MADCFRIKEKKDDFVCAHCGHQTDRASWKADVWDPTTQGKGWQENLYTGLLYCSNPCADNATVLYA